MTIDEIKEQKRALEADLQAVISARVESFNEKTGFPVSGINIGWFTVFGASRCLGSVTVEVDVGL